MDCGRGIEDHSAGSTLSILPDESRRVEIVGLLTAHRTACGGSNGSQKDAARRRPYGSMYASKSVSQVEVVLTEELKEKA
jgi:hypothetical protein